MWVDLLYDFVHGDIVSSSSLHPKLQNAELYLSTSTQVVASKYIIKYTLCQRPNQTIKCIKYYCNITVDVLDIEAGFNCYFLPL